MTTENDLGAGGPILPAALPAESGSITTPAPILTDPMECPHIRTGAEQVALQPPNVATATAVEHAADWVSRNAPNLYTFAQALQILKGLFSRH